MWYSTTKIGIMEIDMDHSNVDTMLQLYFHGQAPREYLENIVDGLIRHYSHEEEVIVCLGYQFPQNHRDEHVRLASLLKRRVDDWKNDRVVGNDLAEEIRAILLLHVAEFDVKLIDYETLTKL
jgi:hemerythrin